MVITPSKPQMGAVPRSTKIIALTRAFVRRSSDIIHPFFLYLLHASNTVPSQLSVRRYSL